MPDDGNLKIRHGCLQPFNLTASFYEHVHKNNSRIKKKNQFLEIQIPRRGYRKYHNSVCALKL